MIPFFHRKELILTMSMDVQAKVREILSVNGIEYYVVTRDLQAPRGNARGRIGTFGFNAEYAYEYKIYVHKKDHDLAMSLIGRG